METNSNSLFGEIAYFSQLRALFYFGCLPTTPTSDTLNSYPAAAVATAFPHRQSEDATATWTEDVKCTIETGDGDEI